MVDCRWGIEPKGSAVEAVTCVLPVCSVEAGSRPRNHVPMIRCALSRTNMSVARNVLVQAGTQMVWVSRVIDGMRDHQQSFALARASRLLDVLDRHHVGWSGHVMPGLRTSPCG